MNKKLAKNTALNATSATPKFKTRLDAVCYNQAILKEAIGNMIKALKSVEPRLTVSDCKFKLFISFALPREEFCKPKRFLVYVNPKDGSPDWNDIAAISAYIGNFQLGRIKIENDFGHHVIITAYTLNKLRKRDDFMAFLGKVVVDDTHGAFDLVDKAIRGYYETTSVQDETTGCINVFWTRR